MSKQATKINLDEYEEYTPQELQLIDKYKYISGNTMEDEEVYDIIIKHNFDEDKIYAEVSSHLDIVKKKGDEYGWGVVSQGKVKIIKEVKKEVVQKKNQNYNKQRNNHYDNFQEKRGGRGQRKGNARGGRNRRYNGNERRPEENPKIEENKTVEVPAEVEVPQNEPIAEIKKAESPKKEIVQEETEVVQEISKPIENEKNHFNVETELNKILEEKENKTQVKETKSLYTLCTEHFLKDNVTVHFENLNFLGKPKTAQKSTSGTQAKINTAPKEVNNEYAAGYMKPQYYNIPQPHDPQYYNYMSYLMTNSMYPPHQEEQTDPKSFGGYHVDPSKIIGYNPMMFNQYPFKNDQSQHYFDSKLKNDSPDQGYYGYKK